MENKISILIVTYNSLDKFKKCFDSLKKILNRDDVFEVLIFDNKSNQETVNFLKQIEDQQKIKVFYSEKNLGCGGARKELMKKASGNKVLILDPDIVVIDELFLDKLITKEKESSIGIVGCAGGNINKSKIQFDMVPDDYEGLVDAVCGYCQFFDTEILKECQIDDFYYPNGEEDFDFCLQVKQKLDKEVYKFSQEIFGLIHDYSYTNRDNLDLRNKNFKYMFNKFNLYDAGFLNKIIFKIKSNILFRKIDRLIGKINK